MKLLPTLATIALAASKEDIIATYQEKDQKSFLQRPRPDDQRSPTTEECTKFYPSVVETEDFNVTGS